MYVPDRYEGTEARAFPELSAAELERYLERNVAAVAEVAERVKPDLALANHLVMGPLILARALAGSGVPYAVKIHGSALEYTVKPHPRFLPYAREGVAGARAILVGSRHTAESLWAAVGDPTLEARTRLGPPGVDVATFRPREPEARGRRAARARGAVGRRDAAGGQCGRLRPRPEQRRRGAGGGRAGTRPPRRVRGQADREQGDRSAARRVAAGARAGSRGAAPDRGIRRLERRRAGPRRGARRRRSGGRRGRWPRRDASPRVARERRCATSWPSSTASRPIPGSAPRTWLRPPACSDRIVFGRAPRARRAGGRAARVRGDGRPEHVPRGVRDGGGGGGGLRARCRSCAGTRGWPRSPRTLAAAVPPPARPWLAFRVGDGAVEAARRRARRLARGRRPGCAPPRARRWSPTTRERYSWDGVARAVIAAARGDLDALPTP